MIIVSRKSPSANDNRTDLLYFARCLLITQLEKLKSAFGWIGLKTFK